MKKYILLVSLLFLISINFGCSPAGMLASGGAGTMAVAEGERSLGQVVDDATIKVNVSAKFLSSPDSLFVNVDTSVLEGRVLLTGLVENQEIRIDAVKRVWEVEGVKEVINEIQIGDRESIKEYANDLWITAQAKALTIKTVGLRAISYNFETINGKIYIAGITSRPDQLELVINSLKSIKGAKEIVNYVVVKN
tara:strand:- start:612 stop:1193 length:582 start_codon:yes stop_codon:yes gene_type:complete